MALGQSFGVLLDRLVDCLVAYLVGWLVGRSLSHRIIWTIGRLVFCWMVGWWVCWMVKGLISRSFGWKVGCCVSGVWSIGRLAIESLAQLFGGKVGCCVGRLVCGRLEDWSVRLSVI